MKKKIGENPKGKGKKEDVKKENISAKKEKIESERTKGRKKYIRKNRIIYTEIPEV